MKILSGTSNLKLSKDIAKKLKLKLVNTNIRRFADGEIYIEINENIKDIDDNKNLELLCGLMIEAAYTDGQIDESELNKIKLSLINIFFICYFFFLVQS